jgi:soluble lytic murein transglycosylase-like protein
MALPDWSASNFAAVQSVLDAWADTYGLERSLVYAVVSQESRFNPNAVRPEPQINDASYGLTQILYGTAQGLGYTGTPAGLYDPDTNAEYGLRYLFNQVNKWGGNLELALSAYNGGLRGTTVTNPAYVAGVLDRKAYFDSLIDTSGGVIVYDSSTTATAGGGFLAVLFLAIGLGYWWQHSRRS